MSNKLQTIFLYITIIFSLAYLLSNITAIITEVIFYIKNQSFIVYLKASLLFNIFRIFFPILIFIFTLFIKYKIKIIKSFKKKILNIIFNLIFSIALFLFIIMLQYAVINPDFITEIQTIPFGALNLLTLFISAVLTIPMVLIVIAMIILFINIRISEKY